VQYDDIIVGGGTSGSVIAARLSEDRARQVLLLEAGPDYPDRIPEALLDVSTAVTHGHNWEFQAILAEPRQTTVPYPLGKVMGGGSAINGGLALYARAEDHAAWEAAGNDEWSWARVQPFMNRIAAGEDDKPALPLETTPSTELTRCQGAFIAACLEIGHRQIDLRQGTTPGVGVVPKSVRAGQRLSTARLYLAAARTRPNLTVRPQALVDRLVLERRNGRFTASGVEALIDGRRCSFSSGRIVLSSGAINSPAILLRSGIGPSGEIARAGGTPLLDLPGVGKNLQDHPAVSIWAVPTEGACAVGEAVHQAVLQLRSGAPAALCDLQLFMLSGLSTSMLPPLRELMGSDCVLGISVVVATPTSRGRVEILDRDPTHAPRICLNCLQDDGDLRRMMDGVRSAWRLLQQDRLAGHVQRLVWWHQSLLDSDRVLQRVTRTTVRPTWHPVGTLRMGRDSDPMAVVDQRGQLYGCGNVTVADASIMPTLPSVPTNLTCMLIGERIAAHLCGSTRSVSRTSP
jgi:choline dehydrogenase